MITLANDIFGNDSVTQKSFVRDVREETTMSRFVTEYADCDVDNYTLIFKI